MRGSRHASQMLCPHGRTRGDFTVLRQTGQFRKSSSMNVAMRNQILQSRRVGNKQGASLEFLLVGMNYSLSVIFSLRGAPDGGALFPEQSLRYRLMSRCRQTTHLGRIRDTEPVWAVPRKHGLFGPTGEIDDVVNGHGKMGPVFDVIAHTYG